MFFIVLKYKDVDPTSIMIDLNVNTFFLVIREFIIVFPILINSVSLYFRYFFIKAKRFPASQISNI